MESILGLLDKVEDTLDESNVVPFTSKVLVDKDELHSLIAEVRIKLPTEVKQSRWVVEERNKILLDAKKEAENILEDAKRKMELLVGENEVTKNAMVQAEAIVGDANETAREMRIGAMEYADDVLFQIEKSVKNAMEHIHQQFVGIEDYLTETASTIHNNREELRGRKN